MEAVLDVRTKRLLALRKKLKRHDAGPSDSALLVQVADGEWSAFDELYRRYSRAILGLALRRLGDRGRAEDATQDAFTAIWRTSARFDPDRGSGAAWLYAVARNAIVDEARRKHAPPVADPPDLVAREPLPDEEAEAAWTAWRLHRALAVLPEHESHLLELAYYAELSQSEIAAKLDMPLGTVKTRTRSALSRLAELLDEELQ
jgi:RNA polymerase sigma-70 factor, ECF subfamily